MNINQLIELNAFKEAVAQKRSENAKLEISDFASIKNAENMDLKDLLEAGRHFVLIGLIDKRFGSRPTVYNLHDGAEYPKHEIITFFPMIDLRQNLIEMQDVIDVVPDPEFDLNMIIRPGDELNLVNVEQVFGKAVMKNNKLEPGLTLAEVVSQLALNYKTQGKYYFYVCDAAEDACNLTSIAGYHAYRVAVYTTRMQTTGVEPDLTADGIPANEII